MDYHQERFHDFSLLIYKEKKLVALLPANKVEDKLYSHQGLTYGGLILKKDIGFKDVVEVLKVSFNYLLDNNFKSLYVSLLPNIYKTYPSDEINYLMFKLDAKLIKRETSSSILISDKLKIQPNRLQGKKKADKLNLIIKEEETFNDFWNLVLIPNLKETYKAKPVHSIKEISLLKERFPNSIRQFNVYYKDKIVAGTTIFETQKVAHVQYISANNEKQKLGSLDYLFEDLINNIFKNKIYFDFGTSNKNDGHNVNEGLIYWKEGFGARTIVQDFYEINLNNISKLDTVFE